MDGGTQVAEVLKAHGVRHLFTLVGGHISPILVAARKAGLRVVDFRHEVNAVFAADAVSRLTGVPGVAAVTAGPGVTNAITAIKNAQLAQSPLVLLGGATATMLRGRGSLQDIDQMSLMKPHVKWASRPNRLREVVPALERAFEIARSGVPGPVFVELAVDLLYDESIVREWYKAKTDKPNKNLVDQATSLYIRGHLAQLFYGGASPSIRPPEPVLPVQPKDSAVREAARKLASAERPVMVLGSQTMMYPTRARELVEAVERIGIPVYLSGMARGLLGRDHPLQFRHKRRDALRGADLVILAGVPCDFRLDYGAHVAKASVVAVNLSEEDLRKNRRPDMGVQADPHTFLVAVSRALAGPAPARAGWFQAMREREAAREAEIDKMAQEPVSGLNPLEVCRAVDAHLSDDSMLIGDGGDFVATAAYTVAPRGPYSWLDPGVFGTLGVGAGFAIGAKLVRPEADVWLLYGDGAAGFSIMELDTCVRHGLPIIAVVGNDGGWTQIARDQVPMLGDDVATRLTQMDYHRVAEACGGKGIRVDAAEQLNGALDEAVAASRAGSPVLVNAIIGRTEFRKGSISM
jgi:acetolactate synthase-1/2/3 large subunit